MLKVFKTAGGGKTGASLAVIVAHAAPFMGAQTTNLQRYFLPNPLDTIISQPFGMSEDLLSMAMGEAFSKPVLASRSLTGIICGFNIILFAVFSKGSDIEAFVCAILNIVVGLLSVNIVSEYDGMMNRGTCFRIVACQLMTQMFLVPFVVHLGHLLCMKCMGGNEELDRRVFCRQQLNEELDKESVLPPGPSAESSQAVAQSHEGKGPILFGQENYVQLFEQP